MNGVRWLDEEKGIILWKFHEDEPMEEIMDDLRTFADVLNKANRKTYTIVDFLEMRSVPKHAMGFFPEMAKLTPTGEKRSEIIALVSQRSLITMLTEIFAKVYPDFRGRFMYFASVSEALDAIYEHLAQNAA